MTPAKAVAQCTRMIRDLTKLRHSLRAFAARGAQEGQRRLPRKRRSVVRAGLRFKASNGKIYQALYPSLASARHGEETRWMCSPVNASTPRLIVAPKTILLRQTSFQPRTSW